MRLTHRKNDAYTAHRSHAKIVDGSLILSLPEAINPVVWRMELGSVKASAIEVREKDASNHLLILKTPRGDYHDIAAYDTREKAVNALMSVSSAFQTGDEHAPIRNAAPSVQTVPAQPIQYVPPRDYTSGLKWLAALAAVIVAIALFAYLGSLGAPQLEESIPGESTATSVTGEANTESGVPQSADQMLRGF